MAVGRSDLSDCEVSVKLPCQQLALWEETHSLGPSLRSGNAQGYQGHWLPCSETERKALTLPIGSWRLWVAPTSVCLTLDYNLCIVPVERQEQAELWGVTGP